MTEATREIMERMMPGILYAVALVCVLGIVGGTHDLWRRCVQWRKRRARAKRPQAVTAGGAYVEVGRKKPQSSIGADSAVYVRDDRGSYVTLPATWDIQRPTTKPGDTKPFAFKLGDPVQRSGGSYRFPGVVIGRSRKLDGVTALYTVECVARGCQGICHDFREGDLERREAADPNQWEGRFLDDIMPDLVTIRRVCGELIEKRLNVRGHRELEDRLLDAARKLDEIVWSFGVQGLGTPLDAPAGTATGGGVR